MATTFTVNQDSRETRIVAYAALGNENGDAFELPAFADKTIQATGTGTVTVQGSANGTNWEPLKDQTGTLISIDSSTDACAVILENPRYMRAVNTAASALVVITCCK